MGKQDRGVPVFAAQRQTFPDVVRVPFVSEENIAQESGKDGKGAIGFVGALLNLPVAGFGHMVSPRVPRLGRSFRSPGSNPQGMLN
jgi:hypothetical protein